jgi:drug/metabolite transporter (DMT)-like permease
MSRRASGIALAFVTAAISGVAVFLNGYAVKEFGNATLYTTAKNLVAAILLVAILAVASRAKLPGAIHSSWGFTRPRGAREIAGLVAVGIIGGGIPFVLFFEGLARTSSTSAAFIQKMLVIFVAVLAVTFLKERFTILHAAAIGVLVLGQAIVAGGLGHPALDAGEAMVFAATILWSIEIAIAKPLLGRLSALTVGAGRMAIGLVVLAGFSVSSGAIAQLSHVTPTGWLWAVATGIILTAYVATWYAALARAQATDVTAVLVSAAIVTAVLNAGVKGASLAPTALGLSLIVAGAMAIAVLAARPHQTAAGMRAA